MTDRRIVITGIGVISPLGNDLASTWEAMKAGRSGIDTIKSMDVTGYSTKIAGEVKDFDPAPYFKTPKDARRVDRFTHFAMGAAGMALKDSGLDLEAEDKTRIGVMVGSGIGGLGTLTGPVIGAFVMITMEHFLAPFGSWLTVIQGSIFILCVAVFRRGIVGVFVERAERRRGKAS